MPFFLPVSLPADHTEVGVASDTRAVAARLVWFYQSLAKAQESQHETKQFQAVAGMSVAWLDLSAEEESQQPPVG